MSNDIYLRRDLKKMINSRYPDLDILNSIGKNFRFYFIDDYKQASILKLPAENNELLFLEHYETG